MKLRRLPSQCLICSCLLASPLMIHEAYAQDSIHETEQKALDAYMTPTNGQHAGEIISGEVLQTALKRREKLNSASVDRAIKSISELFNFKLVRSGDKYLYKADASQKITLLRYQNQRSKHIYEATLTPENTYHAKLIDPKSLINAPVPFEQANIQDDEIDVESAAMAQQLPENQPQHNSAQELQENHIHPPEPVFPQAQNENIQPPTHDIEPNTPENTLNALDTANPDDPIQPIDPALAGKPSPDAEFPQEENFFFIDKNHDETQEIQPEDDQAALPTIAPPQKIPPQKDEQLKNTPTTTPFPSAQSNKIKRGQENDTKSATLFPLDIITIIAGFTMMLAALIICVFPAIVARKKCHKLGLHIHQIIRITPRQRIACIQYENQKFIVAIQNDKITMLTPAPADFDAFWKHLKAKTYWQTMANTPLSEAEFTKLLKNFQNEPGLSPSKEDLPESSIVEMHEFKADPSHLTLDQIPEDDPEDKILFNVLNHPYSDAKVSHNAITAVIDTPLLDEDDEKVSHNAITAVINTPLLDEDVENFDPYQSEEDHDKT